MDVNRTRRALVAAILGVGALGATQQPVRGYLDRFAPGSGSAWDDAGREPRTVESPHGEATVRYDDDGVPHVTADGEEACYFAVGYAQAADRLAQMDVLRRLMRGQLSAVVGEAALDSDEFHVRMDFAGAAAANWELLGDTDTGAVVSAYVDGVNAFVENGDLPLEFSLLGYEPEPWTPEDTMLMEKQISWGLTGSFRTLRKALVRRRLGADAAAELHPDRLDHDSPIVRDAGDASAVAGADSAGGDGGGDATARRNPDADHDVGPELVSWLAGFERPPGIGSNSWVVSGERTASGAPIVANDPHLTLQAPPVWYEQNLRADDVSVRGVTFPGVPFVIIGENDAGAWGFTNTGADVIDFYRYDIREAPRASDGSSGESNEPRDGEQYRYRGEWREFETETREIEVGGGENREITVRKTVHGPYIEREGQRVGVAWTGHTATATTRAIYEYSHSAGVDDVLDATRRFDLPTQNLVYADRDGNTLYYVTGRIPLRTVDGEEVRGDRVFDGSAGEAEWEGFEPFGVSSWDGFVPFEEKPHVRNPDYLATANQRVTDDPAHYVGEAYASPYRGRRIYELLDERAASGEPMDVEFVQSVQRDTLDGRARDLVPTLVEAARGSEGLDDAAEALANWNYRMDRDSRGALLFVRWFERYREELFADPFEAAGLDESYHPNDFVVANLDPDSRWFGGRSRDDVMVAALESALDDLDDEGYETYGDYNTTGAITHPFDLSFLNYPAHPTDGSRQTVMNYAVERPTGSSWRMIAAMDGPSLGIVPGGNSGRYFSDHYRDQLRAWADGEYKSLTRSVRGEPTFTFEEGER